MSSCGQSLAVEQQQANVSTLPRTLAATVQHDLSITRWTTSFSSTQTSTLLSRDRNPPRLVTGWIRRQNTNIMNKIYAKTGRDIISQNTLVTRKQTNSEWNCAEHEFL